MSIGTPSNSTTSLDKSSALAQEEALIGKVLGRVRLDKIIGQGSSGVVYRGYHTTWASMLPSKLKGSAEEQGPQFRERFRREAQLTARLDHPGIVRVIDYGEDHGVMFLVMDFVDGYSLENYLRHRTDNPMAEKTIIKIILSLTQALSAAHNDGVIHRDLKPANIMLTRQGRLRLTDLGLAYQVDGLAGMTRGDQAVGTPYYMAPEAFSAQGVVNERSDLYALGIIGYRLAFNTLPYSGSLQQVYAGHINGTADWSKASTCQQDTLNIFRKLMETDPNHRFASAEELAVVLRKRLNQLQRKMGGNSGDSQDSGSGSQFGSGSEFESLARFMESKLGTSSSEYHGGQVVHTTTRERLVVWVC